MPTIRVEFTADAEDDLQDLLRSGAQKHFLAKLVHLEEHGVQVSEALGRGLTNWRKIVVGDRQWRIVFITDPEETVETIWVIGDREDEECYREAEQRLKRLGPRPETQGLSSLLAEILLSKKPTKKRR